MRKNAQKIVLTVLLLCLCGVCFWQVYSLAGYSRSWSLRWQTPVSGQAAAAARRYAAENPEDGLWPTFWREETLALKSELAKTQARGIWYSGEGALVWPAHFVQGGWPGATDEAGCVVSTDLAWRLWGSEDVVGKNLLIEDKVYHVRGVIRQAGELCLAATGDATQDTGWPAAEFRPEADTTRAKLEAFAQGSGLGQADTLLNGSGIFALALCLALVPALLLCTLRLGRWAAAFGKRRPLAARVLVTLTVVALAFFLPLLLGLLPGWAVPAKWSDFSHWTELFTQFSAFVDSLFAAAYAARDVAMKKTLVLLVALAAFCCPAVAWLHEKCK